MAASCAKCGHWNPSAEVLERNRCAKCGCVLDGAKERQLELIRQRE